jgi:hypothetical protein
MEPMVIIGYIVIFAAVVLRLLKSKGWDWKPMFYVNGEFQMNTVFIIITGFIASLVYMNTAQLIAAQTFEAQVAVLWGLFAVVYGTTAGIDAIGTVLPVGNNSTNELPTNVDEKGVA